MIEPELRTVLKITKTKEEKILFKDLKKGDVFKLFESDGVPVVYNNTDIFKATSNVFMTADNVWSIDIIPVTNNILDIDVLSN